MQKHTSYVSEGWIVNSARCRDLFRALSREGRRLYGQTPNEAQNRGSGVASALAIDEPPSNLLMATRAVGVRPVVLNAPHIVQRFSRLQ